MEVEYETSVGLVSEAGELSLEAGTTDTGDVVGTPVPVGAIEVTLGWPYGADPVPYTGGTPAGEVAEVGETSVPLDGVTAGAVP